MKKKMILTISVLLIITSVPISNLTLAAKEYYSYRIYNGKAEITGCDNSIYGDLIIPANIGEYPVTAIDDFAFNGCTLLTSVTIPDTIVTIGENAFFGCILLEKAVIGKNVKEIGAGAFAYTVNLKEAIIYGYPEIIGENAFSGSKETIVTSDCLVTKKFCEQNAITFKSRFKSGDVNGDENIDLIDMIKIKKQALGLTRKTDGADLNRNLIVNAEDLVALKKLILEPQKENLTKISELSWGLIEGNPGGRRYVILDFKNNLFTNAFGCEKSKLNYGEKYFAEFVFDGIEYVITASVASILPDSSLNIKRDLVAYEDDENITIYPYGTGEEKIEFRRISKNELKVIKNTATGEFYNFEVGKILKLATIEIIS